MRLTLCTILLTAFCLGACSPEESPPTDDKVTIRLSKAGMTATVSIDNRSEDDLCFNPAYFDKQYFRLHVLGFPLPPKGRRAEVAIEADCRTVAARTIDRFSVDLSPYFNRQAMAHGRLCYHAHYTRGVERDSGQFVAENICEG